MDDQFKEPPAPQYKKSALVKKKIEVRSSPIHGYGVFATKKILPNEIVEECPLIMLRKDRPIFSLNDFAFNWNDNFHILALGYGSLYNHSSEKNVLYYRDEEQQLLIYKALKTIYPGEEILTDYGKSWFEARNLEIKYPPKKSNRKRIIRLIILAAIFIACFIIFAPS